MLQIILRTAALFVGCYLFFTGCVVTPKRKCEIAVSKNSATHSNYIENLYEYLAHKILPHIHIQEEKRTQQLLMLQTINSPLTPEYYKAKTLASIGLYSVVGFVLSILSGIWVLIPIIGILCWIKYRERTNALQTSFKNIQMGIERDLPKLCSVINSKVASTNNVENILKTFYPIANPAMQAQLDITIADISSGNVSQALQRFEGRIHSPHLSDITRGLIAVSSGDDQSIYFQVKQQELNREYEVMLQKEIEKRPEKLRPLQFGIVILFLACLLYPIDQVMSTQMSNFV